MNAVNPNLIWSGERRAELVRLLALGLIRLRTRQSSELSDRTAESSLHFPPDRSGHAKPQRRRKDISQHPLVAAFGGLLRDLAAFVAAVFQGSGYLLDTGRATKLAPDAAQDPPGLSLSLPGPLRIRRNCRALAQRRSPVLRKRQFSCMQALSRLPTYQATKPWLR
jgi:hypothetical protein